MLNLKQKLHSKIVIGFYEDGDIFPKITDPDIVITDTTLTYAMHRASIKAFSLGWKETSGWNYLPLSNDFDRCYTLNGEKRKLMVHLFEDDICDDQGLVKSIVRDYEQHT